MRLPRPDLVLGTYLARWRLFPMPSWIDTHIGNVYLHRFDSSDDRVLHDHPYWNLSIILKGAYYEIGPDRVRQLREPGTIVLRSPEQLHHLQIARGPVWTLFFHGPRVRTWGFLSPSRGWTPHTDYDVQRDDPEHVTTGKHDDHAIPIRRP